MPMNTHYAPPALAGVIRFGYPSILRLARPIHVPVRQPFTEQFYDTISLTKDKK